MNITDVQGIHLGAGLIGIGRKWGVVDSPIPSEEDSLDFLSEALKLGIFHFDTAASYATSEERLGKFLDTLSSEQRNKLIIATKFGDHWDFEKNEPYVDHSYEALKESLDRSLSWLKKIDLLYLHKARIDALKSSDVEKAFAYAKSKGIHTFGASVSDIEGAEYALSNDFYSVIQLAYNTDKTIFASIIDRATQQGKKVVINRPFNMGKNAENKVDAFSFILQKKFNGFILTGTKSTAHLQENYDAFALAQKALSL